MIRSQFGSSSGIGIPQILGGIGSAFSNFGSLAAGIHNTAVNENIAKENLAFQQENFEYQKALNQLIMEREDSAYQRTVNDMRLAGMSPLAMQTTDSAGSLSAGTAPQREKNDYSGIMNALFSITSQFSQLGQVMSGIKRTDAETEFIKAQAAKVKQDTLFDLDTFDDRKAKISWERNSAYNNARIANIDKQQKTFDLLVNSSLGITPTMTDALKNFWGAYNSRGASLSSWLRSDGDIDSFDFDFDYNQGFMDIYKKEYSSKWSEQDAKTEYTKRMTDLATTDRIIDAFGELLNVFSMGK